MNENKYEMGVVGMGVMGYSLMMNFADHQFTVAGLDTDEEKINRLNDQHTGENTRFFSSPVDFIQHLNTPRKILVMVPAGKAVDAVISTLSPYLGSGDILMDGGNSHFEDTDRRFQQLTDRGIHFWGVGVSGGEEGARFGPSIMPGGNQEVYHDISPFIEAIAAKIGGEPCVTYLGNRSAGHYVKMVHNGIEYGLMQLLAETYDLLHKGLGMSSEEMATLFEEWNRGKLNGFLVEITGHIFQREDDQSPGEKLIDNILDQAKQKGTGKWTSQSALDMGIPVPNIDVAVMMRYVSAFKELRTLAEQSLPYPKSKLSKVNIPQTLRSIKEALYAAFLLTYAQGFHLLKAASSELSYNLQLREIARIWRGGCIIRAGLLNDIMGVFDKYPEIENIALAEDFLGMLQRARIALIEVIRIGTFNQIPVAAFSISLAYLDSLSSERLPANMIQAQRDYFGAHTYQRTDISGTFHTQWYESEQ